MSAQPAEPTALPAPATRSDHRAQIRRAPLVIELSHTVTVETVVDLHAFYGSFTENQQRDYRDADLAEEGFEYFEDYERPMAYLLARTDPEVTEVLGAHPAAISLVETTETTEIVARRNSQRPERADRLWSEADFDALVALYPWMTPPTPPVVVEVDREDLARTPGPNDDPLF